MTRYVEAFSWTESVGRFLAEVVRERPLLHVCSGRSVWRDITLAKPVRCDLYEPGDVRADWCALPFGDGSFGAVFADPPWNGGYKSLCSLFLSEALRVAPVVYLMSPWLVCRDGSRGGISRVWYGELPGVHVPVLLVRYNRREGGEDKPIGASGVELDARGTVLPLL